MIRSAINKLFGTVPEVAAPEVAPMVADVRGAPGTRVHHEYFTEERTDGRWNWLCRVYAMNGAPNEQSGVAEDEASAASAALSWAARTKAILRGEA